MRTRRHSLRSRLTVGYAAVAVLAYGGIFAAVVLPPGGYLRGRAGPSPEALLLALAAVLVLGVPIAAWLTARRVVSPIRRLASTARTISPSNRGERFRIPVTDADLGRLEEELNSALRRMEEALEAQSTFVTNVAHELKTPIAVLVAEAQVARRGARMEENAAFVRKAEQELRHMASLVDSFLHLARMGSEEHRELVYLNDVLRQAGTHCGPLAEQKRVRLVLNPALEGEHDPFVLGDPPLLLAAVENLLRNAVQHSPAGEPVVADVRCDQGTVRVIVTDHGSGIPRHQQQAVFERGMRFRSGPGSGVGLAIVQDVARHHNGSVTVEDSEQDGCRFVLTLPRAPSNGTHP